MLKQRVILIVFVCLTIIGLAACGTPDAGNGTAGSANPTATAAPSPTSVPTQASTAPSTSSQPFQVTSIDMAVTPMSIAGMTCGQNITVTYTATFHVAANSPGGTVQFLYTVNNGRGTTPASLSFAPGETTKTYSFNWQGTLAADNVYPGLGGVVTSIDLAVSPSSIAGMSCNSSVTFTYTVTFHVAPNSSGGTIQFMYTTTNGRGSTNASVTASPGATTVTYKFTSSGVLSSDHTFPDIAEVISSSPDQVNSSQVKPAGQCS